MLLLSTTVGFAQLNPKLPPGSNFDLSAWKLQTLDTTDLSFVEIAASQLTSGHKNNYFYTDSVDGSMVFRVPSNAGTTSGSTYPRVELRHTNSGANWALSSSTLHYLTAELKVVNVAPAKPQMVIGQIHGSETNSELLKIRWTGILPGKCYVEARYQTNDPAGTEYGAVLASGLSLGDLISYTITMKSGTIDCTINGNSASQTYTAYYYGTADRYYFKAGDYLQYNVPDPIIYGQSQFYKLSLIAAPTLNDERYASSTPSEIKYKLEQNYPNPFNPSTAINYYLPVSGHVKLNVYNVVGDKVAELINENKASGNYSLLFNGSGLPSGLYLYKLESGGYSITKKMMLLK